MPAPPPPAWFDPFPYAPAGTHHADLLDTSHRCDCTVCLPPPVNITHRPARLEHDIMGAHALSNGQPPFCHCQNILPSNDPVVLGAHQPFFPIAAEGHALLPGNVSSHRAGLSFLTNSASHVHDEAQLDPLSSSTPLFSPLLSSLAHIAPQAHLAGAIPSMPALAPLAAPSPLPPLTSLASLSSLALLAESGPSTQTKYMDTPYNAFADSTNYYNPPPLQQHQHHLSPSELQTDISSLPASYFQKQQQQMDQFPGPDDHTVDVFASERRCISSAQDPCSSAQVFSDPVLHFGPSQVMDPMLLQSTLSGHDVDVDTDASLFPSLLSCLDGHATARATVIASDMYNAEGDSLRNAGVLHAAEEAYNNALNLNSSNAMAWYSLAVCLRARAETNQSLYCFRTCLRFLPKYAPALYAVGTLLRESLKPDQALPYFRAALESDPKLADAASGLACVLRDLSRAEEAIPYYVLATQLAPTAECYANLGNTYKDLNRVEESIVAYKAALALQPYLTDVFCNMVHSKAIVCDWTNRDAEFAALEVIIDRQLAAISNAACAATESDVMTEAELASNTAHMSSSASLEPSLQIFDHFSQSCHDNSPHGSRLQVVTGENSVSALSSVASLPPSAQLFNATVYGQGSWSSGVSLSGEGRDAVNDMLNLDVDQTSVSGYMADTSSVDVADASELARIEAAADTAAGAAIAAAAASASTLVVPVVPSVQPFHALIWPLEPEKFLAITKVFAARAETTVASLPRPAHVWTFPRPPHSRLKVGYVSSDFCNHPFSHLTQSIYGMHRGGGTVECFCYALTPSDGSVWRNRIESECEPGRFRDISNLDVAESASTIAADGIHILVNCNGYTKGARSELFALRPAPVQVAFMGFPGSLGASYIDYFLTDKVSSPPELAKRMHSEKLLYLPHTYFVNDHKQTSSPGPASFPSVSLTRARYGLPEENFLYCSCNQLYKLEPRTLDSWVRILNRVPNSKLWLLRFPAAAEDNVLQQARARGLEDGRIIFTDCASKEEHVARCGLADLFLDSPTCNAHTGATDALWSGLPVLTKPGNLFASRVAASLLTAAGLPELIAPSMNAYEDIAVELAMNRRRLANIRLRLENSRMSNPLFDTLRWVRNTEYLYLAAWQRYESGLPPAHIEGIDVYSAESFFGDVPSAPVLFRSLPQPTYA